MGLSVLQLVVVLWTWFKRALCSHRQVLWKSNQYGYWMVCEDCGYESPGVQIRPHPSDTPRKAA